MIILPLAAVSIVFFVSSIATIPAPIPVSDTALAEVPATEQWSIPRLDMHMMSRFTGISGNSPWPQSSMFPTTIDYDINMPNYQNAYCHNEWANGTLPDGLAACMGEGGRIRFRMKEYKGLGERRKELSFVLQVFRIDRLPGNQTMWMGEVPITANDPSEPSSYLTCLLGRPFDGLRCNLGGPMSVRKELILEAHMLDDMSIDGAFSET